MRQYALLLAHHGRMTHSALLLPLCRAFSLGRVAQQQVQIHDIGACESRADEAALFVEKGV